MAFSSSTSVADLDVFLGDLVSFAATNAGFTNIGNTAIDSDTLYRLSKTSESVTTYWAFRNQDVGGDGATISNINIVSRIMNTSPTAANFPRAASPNTGSEFHTLTGTFNLRGPFTGYWFFTDGSNVYSVLEIRPGIYAHLAFGHMTKFGTWTGGAYITSTSSLRSGGVWPSLGATSNDQHFMMGKSNSTADTYGHSYFQVANDLDVNDFAGLSETSDGLRSSGNMPPHGGGIASNNPSAVAMAFGTTVFNNSLTGFSLRAPILNLFFFRESSVVSNRMTVRGVLPNAGFLNITNLNPEELTDSDWRVFPLISKTGDNVVAPITGSLGLAYRQIA